MSASTLQRFNASTNHAAAGEKDVIFERPRKSCFIPVDVPLAEEAADLAADYALRGMDAIYVAVARKHGSILITLDNELHHRVSTLEC